MRGPLRLVIDTDTASDDAVALLLAVRTPGVRIEAVTTVAGNVPLPRASRNALVTLEFASAGNVPVHPGCERPLLRPLETAVHVHGADGMGGAPLPEPTGTPAREHAVDALLRLARDRGAELTLVALGPLTNIAAALIRDRQLLDRFRHVYCMAGAADACGNISATAEFNVWADPEAAAIVCDAAACETVTWIGWDASRHDAVMTPDRQRRLCDLDTPLARFAHRVNRSVDHWATEVTGLPGYDLPDPLAMAVALNPSLVRRAETAHVRVATGDETRGQILVDRRRTAAPANLTLVRRVDSDGFEQMLLDACA
ncbi:nucleoside hydrolase [Plantactinospora sp. ZYX-F-223]|uniref:nucleoside hydrolase n=1 Tax=Plantactinospora sp. ZYX-F-223 TaxID=3144103 RepID=UPI0031FDA48A